MKLIDYMEAGKGPEGTIFEAAYANRLVGVCNAVIMAETSPPDLGKFHIVKGKLVLQLPGKVLFFGIANGVLACWEISAKNVAVPA